jgi:hypothetical protein
VFANGVTYHPYQRRYAPYLRGGPQSKGEIGIGRIGSVNAAIDELCGKTPQNLCGGNLKAPSTKRPGLYLTEFGYSNLPEHAEDLQTKKGAASRKLLDRNTYWQREIDRARWFRGTRIDKPTGRLGALDRAVDAQAKWMLIYHTIESPPGLSEKMHGVDMGLFDVPGAAGGADIAGSRPYGRNPKNPRDLRRSNHSQDRKAYCYIRWWAIAKGYFDPTQDTAKKNACPRPGTGFKPE